MSRVLAPTFFCFALILAVGGSLRPSPGETSSVVLPPWVDAESGLRAVIAAGARVLSVEFGGHVIRAVFEDEAARPGLLASRLFLVLRGEGRPCSSGERA